MTNLFLISRDLNSHQKSLTPSIGTAIPFLSNRKKGIALALFLLGSTSHPSHGMDMAWNLGSYLLSPVINVIKDQIPEETKNFVYESTIGNPKEFDEVIKEFTFNRWNTRDLLEKKIIELNKMATYLSENEPIKGNFNFTLPKVNEHAIEAKKYAFRYSEAVLALGFTHECKLLLDTKIDDLKSKQSMTKNEEEKVILDYLTEMKKNLCANLYAKYTYKRNGGFKDKLKLHWKAEADREKYWGWIYHQDVNNSAIPKNVNDILEGNGHLSIKNYLQKVWNAYESTISFLKTKEIDLVDQYYNHQLNIYQEKFHPLFDKQPPSDVITCKLISDFDKKLKEGWNPTFSTNIAPMNPPKTNSRPIPKGIGRGQEIVGVGNYSPEHPITTKSQNFARSGSFSEQSSSLPMNFAAAMEDHYKKNNTSPSSSAIERKRVKEDIPQTLQTPYSFAPILPNIPTPTTFQMNTLDDYSPKVDAPLAKKTRNTDEYTDSFSESGEHHEDDYVDQSDSYSSSDEDSRTKGLRGKK